MGAKGVFSNEFSRRCCSLSRSSLRVFVADTWLVMCGWNSGLCGDILQFMGEEASFVHSDDCSISGEDERHLREKGITAVTWEGVRLSLFF